ncbi:MFS transporter [Demequina soli]|uniref:MFS transporter n=1 Tax=Demequina soli TaxID=1638987 RepID=UPI0007816FB9|nr:MFS transporter [Demequina soli]
MSHDGRAPRVAWIVFVAAVAAYFVAVVHRTALGVAGPVAVDRFGIEATGLAMLSVTQIGAYALMQIPAGRLIDKLGPRAVMVTGLLVMSAGQLVLAHAHSLSLAIVARVLIGAGDAPIFIGASRLVSEWFPPRQVPVLVQVTGLIGQAGQLASAIPVAALLHAAGWSATFSILAAAGVVVAVGAGLGLRRPPATQEELERERLWAAVRGATGPAGTRLGFWVHFVTPFMANTVALLWGVPFLVDGQGVSAKQASLLLSVLTVSAMASGPIAGIFAARHPLRRTWLVLGSAITTAVAWAAVLAFDTPRPLWQLALLMVATGIGGPVSIVGIDFARTFTEKDRLATASGFVNMGGFVATIVAVLTVGLTLQAVSPPGAATYTLGEYRIAFSLLVVPWAVGLWGVIHHRRLARRDLERDGIVVPTLREALQRVRG